MISFIFGILLFLAGIIGGGFYLKKIEEECESYGRKLTKTTTKLSWKINVKQLSALVGILFIILSCIKTVPTGSTGIITVFGEVKDGTLDAGVHFLAPWEKVITMDNRTQIESLDLSAFSSDIQEVTLTYTVNYQINKANAQEIYKTIGTNYYSIIIEPKIQEAVKGVFAKYNAEDLISSRGTLAREVENILIADLENYNIHIVSTAIENIDFTDAFTNAVEAKQVAEQNKLKAKTVQEQKTLESEEAAKRSVIKANAKAETNIIKANNDAEVAKIAADSAEYQGQKDAAIMSNLGQMLQKYPELIDYYYTENWDGKLPTTMLGDGQNILYDVNK